MNQQQSIWIIEDDSTSQFIYDEILSLRYKLRVFPDIGAFRDAIEDDSAPRPDLVIADLRLPDGSFLSFLSDAGTREKLSSPFLSYPPSTTSMP